MLAHPLRHRRRQTGTTEDLVAGLDMTLDQLELARGQGPRPGQDLGGHRDPAQVVPGPGDTQTVLDVLAQPHARGDRRRQLAHPLQMVGGVRIAQRQHVAHGIGGAVDTLIDQRTPPRCRTLTATEQRPSSEPTLPPSQVPATGSGESDRRVGAGSGSGLGLGTATGRDR